MTFFSVPAIAGSFAHDCNKEKIEVIKGDRSTILIAGPMESMEMTTIQAK